MAVNAKLRSSVMNRRSKMLEKEFIDSICEEVGLTAPEVRVSSEVVKPNSASRVAVIMHVRVISQGMRANSNVKFATGSGKAKKKAIDVVCSDIYDQLSSQATDLRSISA